MLDKIMYLLLFALGGALLYGWGMVKSMRRERELAGLLYDKGSRILRRYLRRGALSRREVEVLLQDLQVKPFGSRHGCRVTAPKEFSQALLERLVQKGVVQAEGSGAAVRYRLCTK